MIVTASAIVCCCFAVSAGDEAASGATPYDTQSKGDMICGPRCARFILQHYGHKVELIDLVRSLQWPEVDQGTSVSQMDSAIRAYGIHTCALQLSAGCDFEWPYPVLVHSADPARTLGHFVVRMPGTAEHPALLWDGLHGYDWASSRIDEPVALLLTAPVPIDEQNAIGAIKSRRERIDVILGLGLACLTVALVPLVWRRARAARPWIPLLLKQLKLIKECVS